MRILWHGVPAEFGTGYGTQTDLFTRALRDAGHDVAISSIVPDMWRKDKNGFQVYPSGSRCMYGNDLILGHVADFKADVVVSCMDTHIMNAQKFSRFWWVGWQVVDSDPLPPELARVAPIARTRLAMSKFGARVIKEAGFDCDYVPLAIDCNVFRPCPSSDRPQAKRELARIVHADPFDEDTFLVVMNSANMSAPSRKNFYAAFAGFEKARQILSKQGIRAVMYCHTEPTGAIHKGEDLCTMAESLHIPIKSLFFPPQYPLLTGRITPEFLRGVYCAGDVFLHTARGEGFGLPIVEAMACGCPTIAPHNSSMVEFGCDLYLVDQTPFCSTSGTVQCLVHPEEVCRKLIEAYRDRSILLSEQEQERRCRLVEQYDISIVSRTLASILERSFSKHDPSVVVAPTQPGDVRKPYTDKVLVGGFA